MGEDEILETVTAAPRVIVSFDVRRRRRTECSLVNQFVFGREVTVRTRDGGRRRYRYPGLIARPGVERLGQSVLMMRERDAEDFIAFLGRLRVSYRRERIWVTA